MYNWNSDTYESGARENVNIIYLNSVFRNFAFNIFNIQEEIFYFLPKLYQATDRNLF